MYGGRAEFSGAEWRPSENWGKGFFISGRGGREKELAKHSLVVQGLFREVQEGWEGGVTVHFIIAEGN